MMMRTTFFVLALAAATAHAQPTITVDDSVPFTAKELTDAVQIRVRDSDARIHIARSGDVIVITVGDRARALEVDDARPHDLARVVALVIVSLAESPISTVTHVAPPPPPPAPPAPPEAILDTESPPEGPSIHATAAAPPPSRYSLRASIGYQRTDGGIYSAPFLASLATAITPNVRFIVSGGLDQHGTHIETTRSALGRVGVEGRMGALGLELGGAGFAFRTCAGDTGSAGGVYGTARIYLPISERTQLSIEAGGYYVSTDYVRCETNSANIAFDMSTPMPLREVFDEYAGHVGVGVEWGL